MDRYQFKKKSVHTNEQHEPQTTMRPMILTPVSIAMLVAFYWKPQDTSGNPAPDISTKACGCSGSARSPSNCTLSQWTAWSVCSRSCGGGQQQRNRQMTAQARNGGNTCSDYLTAQRSCNSQDCPTKTDCVLSSWSKWTECTKPCHGGVQNRSKSVLVPATAGGTPCDGHRAVQQECNTKACPVDCVLSDWSPWSACSKSCGQGVQTMTRTIETQPSTDGQACGLQKNSKTCYTVCDIDCEVGEWHAGKCVMSPRQAQAYQLGTSTPTCSGYVELDRAVTTQPVGNGKPCPALKTTGNSCSNRCVKTTLNTAACASSDCPDAWFKQEYPGTNVFHCTSNRATSTELKTCISEFKPSVVPTYPPTGAGQGSIANLLPTQLSVADRQRFGFQCQVYWTACGVVGTKTVVSYTVDGTNPS